jgi:uncharacterized glyoxalase superfamily protein PhnB
VTAYERPAAPALSPFVRSLGYFQGELPCGRERVLPTGDTSLMVNLHEDELRTYHGPGDSSVRRTGGAAFSGPQGRHTVIDTLEQRRLVCVNFRLGGAVPFLDVPLEATTDELVDIEELWKRDGASLRERVLEAPTVEGMLQALEAALLVRIRAADAPDPEIGFAVQALEHGVPVSAVTSRLDVLPKRFVRRFRAGIGLTPKRFARVRRLQRVLGAVARGGRRRVGRGRVRARVLRSVAPHPRLPRAHGPDADGVPAALGSRVEPRARRLTLFSKTARPAASYDGRMTGSPALKPRLVVDGAARAIEYYREVFGADELARYEGPDGKIVHAELAIGDARLTLKDEDFFDSAATAVGTSPVLLMLTVDDVDAVGERMVAAGGTVVFEIGDHEDGRGGRILDPFGHAWMISQRSS